MTGIVIVSHSYPLARAAVDLASQMIPGSADLPIRIAAGIRRHSTSRETADAHETADTHDNADARECDPQPGPKSATDCGGGDNAQQWELGTDAAAIADAIQAVADAQGVLVLMDLGSAVLAAETALEFIDPDIAAKVQLSPAPLVEGLIGAVVAAASGADLDQVAEDANIAGEAKQEHLRTVTGNA
ncbi:PTS-dependent dihydroxyacetone kinase phosphotransferase subunit DhaM [Devriesea agamarum]|uniref:PTS-dependent dihydroxyacetone kinase phosphotransferase subunit DhaM n=1 Tax=Devriesea agamarum TaxID=472569 RepID=UPI00071DDF11|nr:hypothetical protein [Devriesea agamarum]